MYSKKLPNSKHDSSEEQLRQKKHWNSVFLQEALTHQPLSI